jgi:hypothetical protein
VQSEEWLLRTSVYTYSSETGLWSHIPSNWDEHEEDGREGWRHKGFIPCQGPRHAFVNGMLHFIISGKDKIAVVDVQGTTEKRIAFPKPADGGYLAMPGYIAQSQGRLHYINAESNTHLSIWVLEDYDTEKWVLKHRMSVLKMFGEKRRMGYEYDYHVVAMHPDGNVVFIFQSWNLKLIQCDMGHKQVTVRVISTLKDRSCVEHVVPYVPHFIESSVLTNKH